MSLRLATITWDSPPTYCMLRSWGFLDIIAKEKKKSAVGREAKKSAEGREAKKSAVGREAKKNNSPTTTFPRQAAVVYIS